MLRPQNRIGFKTKRFELSELHIYSKNQLYFYLIRFSLTVNQDLLAVIASTQRRMFHLTFHDDFHTSQLQDFLLKRLQFENISTSLNIEDVIEVFFISFLNL